MEPFDDINYRGAHYPVTERRHSPLENAVALVILVALISIPWFTGAVWLAVWAYRAMFSPDGSAIGLEID